MNNMQRVAGNTIGTKRVTVKFAAGMREPESFYVAPGTTALDLLRGMGLDRNFQLSKGDANSVFGHTEPIFPQLQDGDLLYVSSVVDAGSF